MEEASPQAPAGITLVCESCGGNRFYRSRATSWKDQFMRSVLRIKPYRCRACGHRMWHFGRHVSGTRKRIDPAPQVFALPPEQAADGVRPPPATDPKAPPRRGREDNPAARRRRRRARWEEEDFDDERDQDEDDFEEDLEEDDFEEQDEVRPRHKRRGRARRRPPQKPFEPVVPTGVDPVALAREMAKNPAPPSSRRHRFNGKDPVAEMLRRRRLRKLLWTVGLVVATGLGLGLMVSRNQTRAPAADVSE